MILILHSRGKSANMQGQWDTEGARRTQMQVHCLHNLPHAAQAV